MYKVFNNTQDFKIWQVNEVVESSIQIVQLIPVNSHILTRERPNFNQVGLEDGSDVDTNMDTGLCVIYTEETNLIY